MKRFSFGLIIIFASAVGVFLLGRFAIAEEQKDARITQVVREVRVLAARAAARPASVNEVVGEGAAVRTGDESRAELTFRNLSLTRLGANTVFSFGQAGRELNLTSGAALICVPPDSSGVRISTPAVSAGISGGIAMAETHKDAWIKVIIIEGEGVITLKSSGETITLTAGQMIALPPGAKHFTKVVNINLKILTDKSILIRFAKLPGWVWDLIDAEIARQRTSPPPSGGLKDPTGFDKIDQKTADSTPTPPSHTPRPEPSGSGAPRSLRGKP